MILEYCDMCGDKIKRNYVDDRLMKQLQQGKVMYHVEVMAGKDGCWNDGEICEKCVVNIVVNGKERKE